MIELVPLDPSHIPLMHEWLSAGEALRWNGGDAKTEEEMRRLYLVEKPRGGTRSFVIRREGELIGHVQVYRATDYPEWCALVSGREGDYGLDLFLGRDDLIGRGIGTEVVRAALAGLVFRRPDAKRCILGPSPENGRAIRCYEKCGFRHVRTVVSPDGEREYVMVVERPAAIRPLREGEEADCERILRSLPDWFGMEESIVGYVRDVGSMETFVAEAGGEPVGFLTLRRHNARSAEIQVMAVVSAHHRRGLGRRLVERAVRVLRSESVEFLQVKTLGPSREHEPYARTRAFYERMGFAPLEENRHWGEENPCLVMVRHLPCAP